MKNLKESTKTLPENGSGLSSEKAYREKLSARSAIKRPPRTETVRGRAMLRDMARFMCDVITPEQRGKRKLPAYRSGPDLPSWAGIFHTIDEVVQFPPWVHDDEPCEEEISEMKEDNMRWFQARATMHESRGLDVKPFYATTNEEEQHEQN